MNSESSGHGSEQISESSVSLLSIEFNVSLVDTVQLLNNVVYLQAFLHFV